VVAEAAALILALAHLLDNYSVPPLWRDTKLFGRLLDGFLFVGRFDSAKAFSAFADDLDAPPGHGSPPNCPSDSPPNCPSDHVENRYDDDGGSDGNECIEENAMSSS